MIAISKSEKVLINKLVPEAKIVRTVKGKSDRHKYYCEEAPAVLKILFRIRKGISND